MRSFIIIGLCLFLNSNIFGQIGVTHSKGARLLALGNGGATIEGVDALFGNQTGILSIENFAVEFSTERRFNVSDIQVGSFGVVKNFNSLGHIGFMFSSLKVISYREQKYAFTYARILAEKLYLSATFDYIQTHIDMMGSSSIFSFELGLFSKINDELSMGFHVFSPAQVSITETNTLRTEVLAGVKYSPSKKVDLYAEISKSIQYDPRVHVGIEYLFNDLIAMQFGVSTAPATFAFGLGFNIANMRINGAASRHSTLGITPAVSLAYEK